MKQQKTTGSRFGQSLRARLNIIEGLPGTGKTAGFSFGQSSRARINIIEGPPGTGKTADFTFGQSLRARLNVIEGPPGTAKTAIILALIVRELANREKILICAEADFAVRLFILFNH
jgi:hypothetical protein